MKAKKFFYALALMLLGGVALYLYFAPPPTPSPIFIPGETIVDTLYLPQDTIRIPPIIIKVPVRDTIFVSQGDTIKSGIASLDTILTTGDTLSVDYYIEPSVFDLYIGYQLDSIMVLEESRTDTLIVTKIQSKKYDNFLYGFITGNITMLTLIKLLTGLF